MRKKKGQEIGPHGGSFLTSKTNKRFGLIYPFCLVVLLPRCMNASQPTRKQIKLSLRPRYLLRRTGGFFGQPLLSRMGFAKRRPLCAYCWNCRPCCSCRCRFGCHLKILNPLLLEKQPLRLRQGKFLINGRTRRDWR